MIKYVADTRYQLQFFRHFWYFHISDERSFLTSRHFLPPEPPLWNVHESGGDMIGVHCTGGPISGPLCRGHEKISLISQFNIDGLFINKKSRRIIMNNFLMNWSSCEIQRNIFPFWEDERKIWVENSKTP